MAVAYIARWGVPNSPSTLLMLTMLLPGCGYMPSVPTLQPHKIDIQQGNVITQDMLAQLAPEMDKKKVKFIMGSPIVQDTSL